MDKEWCGGREEDEQCTHSVKIKKRRSVSERCVFLKQMDAVFIDGEPTTTAVSNPSWERSRPPKMEEDLHEGRSQPPTTLATFCNVIKIPQDQQCEGVNDPSRAVTILDRGSNVARHSRRRSSLCWTSAISSNGTEER